MEHGGVSIELIDTAVYIRYAGHDAGVVDQVPSLEIVASVDHDIVVRDDIHDVVRHQSLFVLYHVDTWIQIVNRLGGRQHFRTSDIGRAVDNLTLQVGHIHHIEIH